MLKVVAQGFVMHGKSYMRDNWNKLDFIILVSMIELLLTRADDKTGLEGGNLTLIRMLRLFRPLRSLNALSSLKFMVSALLRSLGGLVNVFIFLSFVLSIFAILGVNLFCGSQYRACRSTPDLINFDDGSDPTWPMIDDLNDLCFDDV